MAGSTARRGTGRSPTSSAAGRTTGCPGCSASVPISPLLPLRTRASSPRERRPGRPCSCARPAHPARALRTGCPRRRGSNHPSRSDRRWSTPIPSRRGRRRRPAARPRTGLGVDRRAAAAERRRRGCTGGRQAAALGGLRPCSPDRAGAGRGRGAGWPRSVRPARALLEHVDETRRRGDGRLGPAHRAPRGRRHAGRGAAGPPAAGAPRRRPGRGCPARSALALRGGHTTREPVDDVPDPGDVGARRGPGRRARPRARRSRSVRRVELLLDHWGAHPPAELRSRRARRPRAARRRPPHLHVDEPTAALLVEVAAEAGLLAPAPTTTATRCWLPTDAFDAWMRARPAERWVGAGRAPGWTRPRLPGLVGSRDPAGKAVERAVARERQRATRPRPAAMALDALAALPRGRGAGRRHRPAVAGRAAAPGCARAGPRTRADQVAWALRGGDGAGRGRARRAAVVRPRAAGRRRRRAPLPGRRCCPSRSTTCCSRPT